MILLMALVLGLPQEASVILELPIQGDAWVEQVRENVDESYTIKIVNIRNPYGGECTWTDMRDFDFLTVDPQGDTLGLTTHASTDAHMLWDVLEMRDGEGYILYADYRSIPDDMGEPNPDWYFSNTFPFSTFEVTRISLDGDTVWTRMWDEDSVANGLTAKLLWDNSVLALTEHRDEDGIREAHLHRIDGTSGDILWEQVIPAWDGLYPYDMATNGYYLMVVHGVELNRHLLVDLEDGRILRVDTLPAPESVHLAGTYPMSRSEMLVCRLGDYSQGQMHIAALFGAGIADDRIWLGPSLSELGLMELVYGACHVDGSSWAMMGAVSYEDPTIVIALMDGLGTLMGSIELEGMTGIPDEDLLDWFEVDSRFRPTVEWGYRPVESLQYTGDGRFVTGINNLVMLEGDEPMRCLLWVIEAVVPEA
ncbi:hypothetical protein JW921_07795 [Candidatus Fermentibacterales bacterium]|nr:hypothetical protein [Candidatus Fermentibacterales bacterium]